uniref:Putative secreted protein n=1 Tax=Anopheles darlingi TaxID=43151 RepID=A0A2M4DFC3_ANODA
MGFTGWSLVWAVVFFFLLFSFRILPSYLRQGLRSTRNCTTTEHIRSEGFYFSFYVFFIDNLWAEPYL